MTLRVGDWVEVASKEEILASLDQNGCLDGMPFMPEMLKYCGQRFRVYKRAHKTCDTINHYVGRRLATSVHLEGLRCDGTAHGGCQAECLLFWKQAWLMPIKHRSPAVQEATVDGNTPPLAGHVGCSEDAVRAACRIEGSSGHDTRYVCQATQLLQFTAPLPWWDVRQYVEDFTSGNATLRKMFRAFMYFATETPNSRRPKFRRLHDRLQALFGGIPFPRRKGTLPAGTRAPSVNLDLKPGELVRVKSYEQILATFDQKNNHLGLVFDAEQVPYCGGTYRVRTRVETFVDEKTGRLRTMKTPAVILENVWCQSCYSPHRMLCPRSIYSWWREAWLERVPEDNRN